MELKVEPAGLAYSSSAATALAEAFKDDPVWSAVLPDDRTRRRSLQRFFTAETALHAFPQGLSMVAREDSHVVGAAIVFPPGGWLRPWHWTARHAPQFVRALRWRTLSAMILSSALDAAHPPDDHRYLATIGSAQPGRGVGGALLQRITEEADEAGLSFYLEATTPTSARLYRRYGFEDLGELRHKNIPPLYRMLRPPHST